MDPMGVYSLNPLRVIKFYKSQWISPVLSDPFRNPNCTKWRSYSYISVYIIYMYTHYQLQKKKHDSGWISLHEMNVITLSLLKTNISNIECGTSISVAAAS